ncbi:MAG: polysaccharide deacetylase family protein [Cyclobacteriaceae bacterium]|nr:polysaccharide deacetylase family protein [Cyclobacteriaceae bacterium]
MHIHRTPFFLPWLYPNLIWRMPGNELYLTLDDGPVPGPTEFTLDILNQFNIKATFFCIGDNVRKHADVYNRIIEEGHAVANHTFNHLNGWNTSLDLYTDNVVRCEQVMHSAHKTGKPASKLFRPPYGRITRAQIKSLTGYKIIMWDVLSFDYDVSLSPEACLKNSIKVTRPGSIIVFHDSHKAEKNMRYALPRYIDHCLQKGYSFNRIPV